MAEPSALAERLHRYRVAAGLTQEELAERAGISARAVSDLERGIIQTPRKDTLQLLAAALGLAAEERATFIGLRRLSAAVGPAAADEAMPRLMPARRPAPSSSTQPPLVGRLRELALLEAHLAGEGPPVLLLAGEPGIGKSRLLQHTAQQAMAAGWQVLAGGCQRRGGQEPYAPLP
jgi:transcriptional regulator with XRE-family HTH domain